MFQHRQFSSSSAPSFLATPISEAGAQARPQAHCVHRWEGLGLPLVVLLALESCQGKQKASRQAEGAKLHPFPWLCHLPCPSLPGSILLGCPSSAFIINSLDHLCIENKSVCFVRKVWKVAKWS
jgi:hypothetical protein